MTTLTIQFDPLWSWGWLIFGIAFRKLLMYCTQINISTIADTTSIIPVLLGALGMKGISALNEYGRGLPASPDGLPSYTPPCPKER